MLLDRNGDLVTPPTANAKAASTSTPNAAAASSATLDPRIGPNIRLGDDPAALPASMRAQAEPHIMRSPLDPDFVVAAAQEGRYSDGHGGAVDCGYSASHDGGLTWSRALLPLLTTTTGGPYYRATDPVVAFDLNSNVFISTDVATDPNFTNGVIAVSRSSDGGASFQKPSIAYDPAGAGFADKEWIAANTFASTAHSNRLLVTWTLFVGNVSPLMRTYSDDAGQTWAPATFITPTNSAVQGSQPVFLANDKVVLVYFNYGTSPERLEAIVSDDSGATFGTAKRIAATVDYNEPQIRTGGILPSAATDRTTGNVYVVWQTLLAGLPRIVFSKSTDSGNTWSAPIAISDNPAGSGVFNPAIAASADGKTLTATFYDHRDNAGSQTVADMYLAQSFDGGATWQPNIRLSSRSIDFALAPRATGEGYMLGDYLGVANPTNAQIPAVPVWIDTRTGNPDPFVTRAGIAPQFDFTSWQAARLSAAQIRSPQGNLKQLNISTRGHIVGNDGENHFSNLIAGFIITGNDPKRVIVRGLGPSLAVNGAIGNPALTLFDDQARPIAANGDWQNSSNQQEIRDSNLAPTDPAEAAILTTLAPGTYTAEMSGECGTQDGGATSCQSGIGLVELYDLGLAANSTFANISTRGRVEPGDDLLIGGVIIGASTNPGATGSARIVFRAIGPSLTAAGVVGALPDPLLELHDADGTPIFANDNWKETQPNEIEATGLAPKDDRESAIVVNLPPSNYTAIVRGKGTASGIALVEAYNVP